MKQLNFNFITLALVEVNFVVVFFDTHFNFFPYENELEIQQYLVDLLQNLQFSS